MNKITKYIFLVFSTLSFCCKQNSQIYISATYPDVEIAYDTVLIQLDSIFCNEPLFFTPFLYNDSVIRFIARPKLNETIELYDTAGRLLKHYKLKLPCQMKGDDVKLGVNENYIYFINDSVIGNINLKSDKIQYKPRPRLIYPDGTLLLAEIHSNFKDPIIVLNDSELIFSVYNPYPKKYTMINSYPVMVRYNYFSNRYSFLNIFRPEKYQKYDYGFYTDIISCRNKNIITYSFESSTEVFQFDILNNTLVNKINAKSKFQDIQTPAIGKLGEHSYEYSSDERFRHMIKSAQYTNIFFNPFNHFYYRTIIGDLVQKDSTGTKRTYQDKNRYCQVFDSNLSFLYEFKLPKQTWVEYLMLPNQTGFTCSYGIRNVKDNYFKFLIIRHIK